MTFKDRLKLSMEYWGWLEKKNEELKKDHVQIVSNPESFLIFLETKGLIKKKDEGRLTNFDKLLQDPESRKLIIELAIESIPAHFCINTIHMKIDHCIKCKECEFNGKGKDCDKSMIDWLKEEYIEGGE